MYNDDDEYEEETQYITLDFGTSVTADYIQATQETNGGIQLVGLESGEVIVQAGGLTFAGNVDETVNTHMLFEVQHPEKDTTGLQSLLSSMRKNNEELHTRLTVKHIANTEKTVVLSPVNLIPKSRGRFKKEDKEEVKKKEVISTDEGMISDDEGILQLDYLSS